MQPAPRKIKLAGENKCVAVEWSDGHRSLYPYSYLRQKCPCATCTDAHGAGARDRAAGATPATNLKNSTLLPMFQAPLKPERAELVGRYAVNIAWNDGHSTGIYSFAYLRELCPCAECTAARAEAIAGSSGRVK